MNELDKEIKQQSKVITINDLRDKEFSGFDLTEEEKRALYNYDKYRISELNHQKDEVAFHKRFLEIQIQANMAPYQDFLLKS